MLQYATPVKKLMAHSVAPVPNIRERREEVPADLAGVVERMLAKDPAERYATPSEAAEALTAFAAGADLQALLGEREDAPSTPETPSVSASVSTSDRLDAADHDTQPSLVPATIRPAEGSEKVRYAFATAK